jgi:predicted PurR-regulated permease PerM
MDRNDRWLSLTLRAALLLLFFWMVKSLLVPIVIGGLCALILHPLKVRLRRRLGRFRGQTPLLVTLGAFFLVVLPFGLIAARIVASVNEFLSRDLSAVVTSVEAYLSQNLSDIGQRFGLNATELRDRAASLVQNLGSGVAGFASSFARALPGQIVSLFLFVLALYYFLRDGAGFLRFIVRLLPFREGDTSELFSSIQETVRGAIVGQLATSAVQGGLTIVVLYVFGIPGALLFGVIAMLLSVLPMLGTTPVTLGATIYLLAMGRTGAAIGMVVSALLIGLSDNIVRPYVQSTQTRMHPLVALLAIFGGIELFGAAGVFIGPVVAAMALWAIDTYADLREKQELRSIAPPPPLP